MSRPANQGGAGKFTARGPRGPGFLAHAGGHPGHPSRATESDHGTGQIERLGSGAAPAGKRLETDRNSDRHPGREHRQSGRRRVVQAAAEMKMVQRTILIIVPATAVCTFCIAAFFGWSIARRIIELRLEERVTERMRIAGELHDTLIQTIHASQFVAGTALMKPDDTDRAATRPGNALKMAAAGGARRPGRFEFAASIYDREERPGGSIRAGDP